jgi:hypothetical protein
MAAGPFINYAANLNALSLRDLVSATVKLAIVTSSYTPNAEEDGHDEWADVSSNEIANGNGYTTGGATLANDAATAIEDGFKYSSDPVSWTASGSGIPAHRYYVMYVLGTLWGKTNPVIGYFVGDSAPADVPLTTAGNTLTATPNANGWFDKARV